jgi:hypothetical protein
MTTATQTSAACTLTSRPTIRFGTVTVLSFLLGGLTSYAQGGFLPDSFASFANSASGWTVLTALLVYFGITLAAMGLLLVPPLLQRDPDLLRILTPVGMWIPALAALLASRGLRDGLPLRRRLAIVPFRPLGSQVRHLLVVFAVMVGSAVVTLLNTAFVFIYSAPIVAGSQAQVGDRLGFAVGWMV